MEIVLSIIALVVGAIAIAQVASLRRENREVLDELKALRTAVDAFEAPARGESAETVVTVASNGGAAASSATPAPAVVAEVKAPVAAASSDIPAHILAVIAASVAGTLRGQYRILAIQAANAAQQVSISVPVIDWSLEGRREIYSSHKLR